MHAIAADRRSKTSSAPTRSTPLSDMQHFVQHQTNLLKRQGLSTYGFAWNEHPAVPDPQNLPALASSLVTY